MNKLLAAIFAGALLSGSGPLLAADPARAGADSSTPPNGARATPGETQQQPSTPPARSARHNPRDPRAVYSAEIKKCNALRGDEKQQCIAAAKKKSGEM